MNIITMSSEFLQRIVKVFQKNQDEVEKMKTHDSHSAVKQLFLNWFSFVDQIPIDPMPITK